jgi:transcriptional regulator with XRE-family HTH domain
MRLDEYRKREGLTQRDIADMAGTTQGFISEIERGEKAPSDELAAKIEELTGGEVTFLELKHPKFRKASGGE